MQLVASFIKKSLALREDSKDAFLYVCVTVDFNKVYLISYTNKGEKFNTTEYWRTYLTMNVRTRYHGLLRNNNLKNLIAIDQPRTILSDNIL